jgi:hypothetical protein
MVAVAGGELDRQELRAARHDPQRAIAALDDQGVVADRAQGPGQLAGGGGDRDRLADRGREQRARLERVAGDPLLDHADRVAAGQAAELDRRGIEAGRDPDQADHAVGADLEVAALGDVTAAATAVVLTAVRGIEGPDRDGGRRALARLGVARDREGRDRAGEEQGAAARRGPDRHRAECSSADRSATAPGRACIVPPCPVRQRPCAASRRIATASAQR